MALFVAQKHVIAAPKAAVLAAIVDPVILEKSIPNCKEVRKVSSSMFWASAEIKVLRWSLVVDATLKLTPTETGYRASGNVRTPRFQLGKITSEIEVIEGAGASTIMSRTTMEPSRKFSRVVEKMATGMARQMTDRFFTRFGTHLS